MFEAVIVGRRFIDVLHRPIFTANLSSHLITVWLGQGLSDLSIVVGLQTKIFTNFDDNFLEIHLRAVEETSIEAHSPCYSRVLQ